MVSACKHKEVFIMTKLFSMKSLACAGAAAFALTLAAVPAPQASAAINATSVNYSAGTLDILKADYASYTKDKSSKNVFIYYGVANGTDTPKKYTLISGAEGKLSDGSSTGISIDISNILGKAKTIRIASDSAGEKNTKDVTLVAAPTLKVSYDSTNATTLAKYEVDNNDVTANITDYTLQYRVGTYGAWTTLLSANNATTMESVIEGAQKLGTTVYVRIAGGKTTDVTKLATTTPWSKEAKLKISGKAKAPKISIKTAALTKAFSLKIGEKSEYQILTGKLAGADLNSDWTPGKADKVGWADIFKDASVDNATSVAVGDAVANDFTILVRTAATTSKAASNVTYQTIKASADSPTKADIEVKPVNGKGKTAEASAASISAKASKMTIGTATGEGTEDVAAAVQYSFDGEKWVNLKKTTQIEYSKTKDGVIYFRFVASDKKNNPSVLPSAITTITIPRDGTTSTDNASKVSGIPVKKNTSGQWTDDTKVNDWNSTT
jgi:hypothetical protein